MAESTDPFEGAGRRWKELKIKIPSLIEKRSIVISKIKRHAETCDDCRRQEIDDAEQERYMEVKLNEKIKELHETHEMAVLAMRKNRPRHDDFHSAGPADNVSKHLAERDRLADKIARLQREQVRLKALAAPIEDLLPQVEVAMDDTTILESNEVDNDEFATPQQVSRRQPLVNHDPERRDNQRHRSEEEKRARGASNALIKPDWRPAPVIDSRSTGRGGGVMIPTDDFHLPGRKYPIIRWFDDGDEWWHIRCLSCKANADSTGFFKDIHDLRVHVNEKHRQEYGPTGGLTLVNAWCAVTKATANDVRRIMNGGTAVNHAIVLYAGPGMPVPQPVAGPSNGQARNVSPSRLALPPSPPPALPPPAATALPDGGKMVSEITPRGTDFKRPEVAQPSPSDSADDDSSQVSRELATRPEDVRKASQKQQQAGLNFKVHKGESSTKLLPQEAGQSSRPPSTQAQRPHVPRRLRQARTDGDLRGRGSEQVTQERLNVDFGSVTTQAPNAQHGPPPSRNLRRQGDIVYPR